MHLFCFTLLNLWCACVNEWHALHEASDEPSSAVSWCLVMTTGSPKKGSLVRDLYWPANGKTHSRFLLGERPKLPTWAKHVDQTFLSQSPFPGLFDHFTVLWGIRSTNIICWIIDYVDLWFMLLLCTFTQTPNLVVMEAPSLARSQKLQEHVWEQGGALAPALSLRLEVTLFAACLRGKRSGKESLSQLCLLSMWTEALLLTMRFLRTQIGSCRIWSDWKWNGLLPLVALALLHGPEEASWWLLSQLLRYSSCGICGNELEGLAPTAQEQKSLFPH